MTARDRFLARVRRHLQGVQPELVRTYLRGLRAIVLRLTEREIARILTEGLDAWLSRTLSDPAIREAFAAQRIAVRHEAERGVAFFARAIPGVPEARVASVFGVLNPRVMDAVRRLDDVVTQRLAAQVRESVRGIVAAGLEAGEGPRTVAKRLQAYIGLSPAEQRQVENFRDALTGANGRRWEDYERRDPRWDATIRRAMEGDGLTPAQVDRMTATYARRRQALSAEANARTAMLDTYRQAQQTAWETAAAEGIVESDGLMKEWLTVGDSRVRPEHEEMNGETVPFDQPYSTGQMVPGEGEWNCRCWSRVFVGRA